MSLCNIIQLLETNCTDGVTMAMIKCFSYTSSFPPLCQCVVLN